MAGRIQNLKPWPKGVSGNPAGRPKNDISVEIARAVFENNPEAIYRGIARRLAKGDVQAFKVLADRAYGRVKERAEVYWSESVVEQLEAGRRRVLEGMSDGEIVERIEQLQRELGTRFGEESQAVLLIGDLPVPAEFQATTDTETGILPKQETPLPGTALKD